VDVGVRVCGVIVWVYGVGVTVAVGVTVKVGVGVGQLLPIFATFQFN
jgi:hypothetical protein